MFAAVRKSSLLVLSIACLGIVSACKDSTGPEEEPEVESIRLTFGDGKVITISSNGTVTGPSVFLAACNNASTDRTVTATFLNAAGQPDPLVTAETFQLAVTTDNRISFTRSGPFSGSLRGLSTGGAGQAAVPVQFGLLHTEEDHVDFGPFPVTFEVATCS